MGPTSMAVTIEAKSKLSQKLSGRLSGYVGSAPATGCGADVHPAATRAEASTRAIREMRVITTIVDPTFARDPRIHRPANRACLRLVTQLGQGATDPSLGIHLGHTEVGQ